MKQRRCLHKAGGVEKPVNEDSKDKNQRLQLLVEGGLLVTVALQNREARIFREVGVVDC